MKTAVITGSTKGIGKAIGKELLKKGCCVVFNYANDEESAGQLAIELDRHGYADRYQIIRADLSSLAGCACLVEQMHETYSQIDYLVLNTASTWRGSLQELTPTAWERVLNMNLTVPLFLTQTCAPRMRTGGCVLFVGAVMGQFPHALSIPYGTSKAAVHYLAKSLVKEFAPQGVRVNCLCPGFVETEWQKKKPIAIRESIEGKIALHRFAEPWEVAEMAGSVLENPYLNGSIVNIDGGYCYQ